MMDFPLLYNPQKTRSRKNVWAGFRLLFSGFHRACQSGIPLDRIPALSACFPGKAEVDDFQQNTFLAIFVPDGNRILFERVPKFCFSN